MRFVVDAQLPPALAGLLRAHGHKAEHVADIGLADASDQRAIGTGTEGRYKEELKSRAGILERSRRRW